MKIWPAMIAVAFWISAATALPDDDLTFEKDIRPILRKHCFDCHGATSELKGELDLRLVRFMKTGGESGESIVAGEPENSYLVERITSGEMPPGSNKVTSNEIKLVVAWIKQGAKTARPEPTKIDPGLGITPEERDFWSLRPVQKPKQPQLPNREEIRTPIDAFILDAMSETNRRFSREADRATLVRRVYLNLTGLPPTIEELDTWINHSDEHWFEHLIDKVLASPNYGERWARHWLDVAGYADSEGFTVSDSERPWAWRYRDWVVQAFNEDKSFDQFVTEQLAGDELAGTVSGDLSKQQIALLTATGFLRMAADGTGSGDNSSAARNQVVADTLKVVGTSLLGLSLQCAQCHDHRYDPILHTDYFSIRAIFEPAMDWQAWKTPNSRLVSLYTEADRKMAAEVEKEAQVVEKARSEKQKTFIDEQLEKELLRVEDASLREPLRIAFRSNKRTEDQNALLAKYPFVRQLSAGSLYLYNAKAADELKKMQARIAEIRATKPQEQFLRTCIEPPNHAPETKLFHRGDFQQPKQTVLPAALTVMSQAGQRLQIEANNPELPTTGRRLAFAQWLTSGRHPLVARVIVNRIWMHHFGRGIVETPSDFGKLGSGPTHPELLDWLANEFVQQGWSIKHLHRLILGSSVWRQTSHRNQENQWDPGNRYYSRKSIQRLDAEAIRDRVLFVSGNLRSELYGKPIELKKDDAGQITIDSKQSRRSIYAKVRRSQPVAMLKVFDAPVMETNCERRIHSTVATQALMMMNGRFILDQSAQLAARIVDRFSTIDERIEYAWRSILSRAPNETEIGLARDFVSNQTDFYVKNGSLLPKGTTAEKQAICSLCQSLFSSNEFLYVE